MRFQPFRAFGSGGNGLMSGQMVIRIEQENDVCVLRISGRMATGTDEVYLHTTAREIKDIGCRNLLVDIREVPSTGSSGVGFLLELYASVVVNAGGRMVLAGPSPLVQEVLNITGLSVIIPIVTDLAAAMTFLTPNSNSLAIGS